ncbi:MAG: M81 family metallopeptidase [Flavobacteriaceae bacterium]|nr:M81 family metallopeptidase [Flavobacteriaceae bacterium]
MNRTIIKSSVFFKIALTTLILVCFSACKTDPKIPTPIKDEPTEIPKGEPTDNPKEVEVEGAEEKVVEEGVEGVEKRIPKKDSKNQPKKLPRIAIAGISIESSTFSPARTTEEAFHVKTGNAVFSYYPFMSHNSAERNRAVWFPTLKGHALPGGTVTREAYNSLVNKLLTRLKKNLPYDGLFFDIHGAMSVVGLDDPEGDLIIKIREVVGTKTLISTCMDLNGNVSKRLAKNTDLITCHRMAPHKGSMKSKKRAVDNLLERLEKGLGKPAYKAYIPVPILLPSEKTSTRVEPGKSLYAKVAPAANQKGVVDAAIWIGYAWADEPRNHAVVMVTGDDKEKVRMTAENLANYFWSVRSKFEFVAPTETFNKALDKAVKSDKHPFMISDLGDNPTAGGAGDVTWTLKELLDIKEFKHDNGPTLIYASIPGADFIDEAVKLGIGKEIKGLVGAQIDARFAPPVELKGTILAIEHGDKDAETEVVVKTGSMFVIVTKKKKPYRKEKDFTHLGLVPRKADIVIVKIGSLSPELYNMKTDWMMALTPGGVDQDIERLGHKRIIRPMYPLDKDMKTPNLKARWIPLADKL